MKKQRYQVTYAGAIESKRSVRSGEQYSIQRVCLRDINDPDEQHPDTWHATAFNQPTLREGDTIEAQIVSDVKTYNGKYYNDIGLREVVVVVAPADDKPFN